MKKMLYDVPKTKKIRVIIDTDTSAEADDQYAIAHALLTPKFDVVGIIAEHYVTENSMNNSYLEIKKILELMGFNDEIPVFKGAEHPLTDESAPILSDGSNFIVTEALKDDDRPLFILNMGAITNLASAFLSEPK